MVRLAAGTFQMGSLVIETQLALDACRREPLGSECVEEYFSNELVAHQVTLSAFWMDRREVTVADYERCVQAGRCDPLPYEQGAQRFRQANYPVSMVSWSEAQRFCAFRDKRLPTEAEWERAARGLMSRRFPWGDHYASRRANHGSYALDSTDASDGFAELSPVGSFPDGRTPEGIEDLAGNVAEWTADSYEDGYEAMPVTDPTGPSHGAFRVVRGGSFVHGLPWLRGAARLYRTPGTRQPSIGFRCVSTAYPRHP